MRRNLQTHRPKNVGQEVAFVDAMAASERDVIFSIILRDGDQMIGTTGLHEVELQVLEHNAAGIRAYEKVGFRREGLLRQHHYVDGAYVDTLVMGLLRSEWKPLEANT